MSKAVHLSRRERQIMDILYELGQASAQDVLERLPDPPSYSTVRALLRKLEEKQHAGHREQGAKFLYFPLVAREAASRNAIARLVRTFFDGSAGQAVNAMLGMSLKDLSREELDELDRLISRARAQSRTPPDKGGK